MDRLLYALLVIRIIIVETVSSLEQKKESVFYAICRPLLKGFKEDALSAKQGLDTGGSISPFAFKIIRMFCPVVDNHPAMFNNQKNTGEFS
jgi:uncharacterized protein YggT (Ycf19 family)